MLEPAFKKCFLVCSEFCQFSIFEMEQIHFKRAKKKLSFVVHIYTILYQQHIYINSITNNMYTFIYININIKQLQSLRQQQQHLHQQEQHLHVDDYFSFFHHHVLGETLSRPIYRRRHMGQDIKVENVQFDKCNCRPKLNCIYH